MISEALVRTRPVRFLRIFGVFFGLFGTRLIFRKCNQPRPCASPLNVRYARVFNIEQCELPQGVLKPIPKIETREHVPIAASRPVLDDCH